MTTDTARFAELLIAPTTGLNTPIWLPLLRLLAEGEPVRLGTLAAASGKTMPEVVQALAAAPDTEYDDLGRIVGQGLTLRPTPYRFEINGNALYTWCSLDTLIFPALLDTTATIESVSPVTGDTIRLAVDADGVRHVEPPTAVVSIVTPEDMSSVRSSFCNQVHFFTSADDAQGWLKTHAGGSILTVDEAHRLGTAIAETLLTRGEADQPEPVQHSPHCC
jgi:alkylmercury lyase|uniref:Alkylmercury lyase n=1 Tax=Rhodococcus sp. Mel TaxID=1093626 RepID=H8ZKX1_9NOCA|nr:putative alkylmercury lyase [Rhodococcus sp. Mel]